MKEMRPENLAHTSCFQARSYNCMQSGCHSNLNFSNTNVVFHCVSLRKGHRDVKIHMENERKGARGQTLVEELAVVWGGELNT